MNRLRADLLLLLTAAIWGLAFIAQKIGNESLPPMAFVGARFLLSAIVILPFALGEARKAERPLQRHDVLTALIIGLLLFVGGALQQIAMITASATHGGFLTALYVVIVPFAMWILTRERVRPFVLIACAISIGGAWLLTGKGNAAQGWHTGDTLLLVSDVAWAFWISLIAVFLKSTYRPFFLALTQFVVTAILAIGASLVFESPTMTGFETALLAILFTGIISGGLAFTLQIVAQRYTPPAEAALIVSLESVFAAIAGAVWLSERLTPLALTGCVLILMGVIVAETGPTLMRRFRAAR
ncbi:MAG: DMT family transporter [Rhodospirillaceae bacterium]|nr:DMT family transporter [Rhodospirillaceae bacterium]